MSTVARDSQIGAELIGSGTSGIRVSQVGVELIHSGTADVPVILTSGGQWKLYRFDVKVRREERA